MDLKISPQQRVCGDIGLPGDQTIFHRLALLAAFADGVSCLRNIPTGRDSRTTLRVLAQLGVACEELAPATLNITGCRGVFRPHAELFDCAGSATTARLLMGLLAGQSFEAVLDGNETLRRLPMEPIAGPLREMGARIVTFGKGRTLPLWIRGQELCGREFVMDSPQPELKCALLYAALQATGTTSVVEGRPTRDHTERALQMAGIRLTTRGSRVSLEGGQIPNSFEATIPGDLSLGAHWLAWAAPREGSRMILRNVGLSPGRLAFVDVLVRMGAGLREEVLSCGAGEWFGHLDVRGRPLRAVQIEPEEIPHLSGEIPLLAVLAARARGLSSIRGLAALRGEKPDWIPAIVTNLQRMGADVEELPDALVITGSGHLHGAELDSFGDPHIAMAFAIAGLLADEGGSVIRHVDGLDEVYPEFCPTLHRLAAEGREPPAPPTERPLALSAQD
jgi:3-phosphoshikimate 1-carboxyvinyltransferase